MQKFSLIILVTLCYLSNKAQAKGEPRIIEDQAVVQYATELGAEDPYLVLAIVKVESNGNRFAVNYSDPSISYGLMQITLPTARAMGFRGKPSDLMQSKVNLKYGIRYLEYQLERYDLSVPHALAAYNAGTAFWKKKPQKFVNQNYVEAVLSHFNRIRERFVTLAKAQN